MKKLSVLLSDCLTGNTDLDKPLKVWIKDSEKGPLTEKETMDLLRVLNKRRDNLKDTVHSADQRTKEFKSAKSALSFTRQAIGVIQDFHSKQSEERRLGDIAKEQRKLTGREMFISQHERAFNAAVSACIRKARKGKVQWCKIQVGVTGSRTLLFSVYQVSNAVYQVSHSSGGGIMRSKPLSTQGVFLFLAEAFRKEARKSRVKEDGSLMVCRNFRDKSDDQWVEHKSKIA